MDTFYLGTHETSWLGRVDVPLFVSHRRLGPRRALPRATGAWALDSGGFSELTMYGGWRTTSQDYAKAVRRYADEIGGMRWAATQDWMCEPFMLAKTGRTVADHQRLTCENYDTLLSLAPDLPWLPVLQGWVPSEYLAHAEEYERRGLPIRDRVVGVGSVCRRQALGAGAAIVRQIAAEGLRLHGFGVKTLGLARMAQHLESADSMAWSFRGRRAGRHLDCAHATGANCLKFALAWRRDVLRAIRAGEAQPELFTPEATR